MLTSFAKAFLDYIRSGYQINLMTAIDCERSASESFFANYERSYRFERQSKVVRLVALSRSDQGSSWIDVALSTCSKHVVAQQPNQYQEAIQATATILLEYDSDKMIAAYGFGAQIGNAVSHCFPLTFNATAPEVPGVLGLMTAYTNATLNVELYGPTNFAPTIDMACSIVRARQGQYLVLLILTDGEITDKAETLAAIVKASSLPISIVIVGVGNADFTAMQELDGDDGPLKDRKGNRAVRDIVQVPLSRLVNCDYLIVRSSVCRVSRLCQGPDRAPRRRHAQRDSRPVCQLHEVGQSQADWEMKKYKRARLSICYCCLITPMAKRT